MVVNEEKYRVASGTKRVRKTVRPRTGEIHRVGRELAKWVRETRKVGIPVETFMLEIEGSRIMKKYYPHQFNSDGTCKFGFTCG